MPVIRCHRSFAPSQAAGRTLGPRVASPGPGSHAWVQIRKPGPAATSPGPESQKHKSRVAGTGPEQRAQAQSRELRSRAARTGPGSRAQVQRRVQVQSHGVGSGVASSGPESRNQVECRGVRSGVVFSGEFNDVFCRKRSVNGIRIRERDSFFFVFSPREGLASVCVSPKAGFASVLFREVSLESSRNNAEARPSFGEQHRSKIPFVRKNKKTTHSRT